MQTLSVVDNYQERQEMIATDCSASDYVDPRYQAQTAMITVCYPDGDLRERAIWIHECLMFLFSLLGAVLIRSGGSRGIGFYTGSRE